jgi:MscS family membrane protein
MEAILDIIKSLNAEATIDLIIAVGIIAVFDIFSSIFSAIILKLFNFKKTWKEIKENTFYMALKSFFRVSGIYIAILFLRPTFGFSADFILIVTKIYKVIVTITIANSLANSITRKSRFIKIIREKSDKDINDSGARILVRVIKTLIYIIAIFVVFAEIGYDLSGLVTGLGLGSIVLTLAAQDTIKNLLGGIIIFMDKPFRVGEMIKVLTYQGTVEDMTLRSTRIRTLDNSLIQIPNSLIASESVENLSKFKRRRYILELELVLNTKMDKIDILKEKIHENLMRNEHIFKDTINIHFTEITSNGFKIIIGCYFDVSDYMEYLDLKEDLNKNIITIINKENIELAYDTKTIEIKR